jgi:hypothetical protein
MVYKLATSLALGWSLIQGKSGIED